jgi:Fe-S oxidoreductase
MREVNVADDNTIRQEFWVRNRYKVLKWVNQKHNNTISAVKKEFISKYFTRCDCFKDGLLTQLVMVFFLDRMGD